MMRKTEALRQGWSGFGGRWPRMLMRSSNLVNPLYSKNIALVVDRWKENSSLVE